MQRPSSPQDDFSPPPYFPSLESPVYSTDPGPLEQRLALTSQSSIETATQTGILRRKSSGITLALKNQDETARIPTYGRRMAIAGGILLDNTRGIVSVVATLTGRLDITIGDVGGSEYEFMTIVQHCWTESNGQPCPSNLPLYISLPETFTSLDGNGQLQLPPSFDPTADGVAIRGLYARIVYRLTIRATRGKWKPQKSLTLDFNYAPRSRPAHPISPLLSSVDRSVITAPEQWFQMNAYVETKQPSTLSPVGCTIYIPAPRIYSKTDSIPFFLRFIAPSSSMTTLGLISPRELEAEPAMQPRIRVFMKRQIAVDERGVRLARSYDIGDGTLRLMDPTANAASGETIVGCEGTLRCSSVVSVGGFDVGKIRVTDFIVISVCPKRQAADAFRELMHACPIRIVTG